MGPTRKTGPQKRQAAARSAVKAGQTPNTPFNMDQIMRDVQRLLDKQDFATVDEANAFLRDLIKNNGGRIPPQAPGSPLEQAEAIVDQAHLQRSPAARVKLARKALALSPDCAAAYLLLADHESHPVKSKALLEQAVEAGRRAINPERFAEYEREGIFWGRIETRPYMRAAAQLAQMAMAMGNRRWAITEFQRLLRLNPGDNQGLRYLLAHCLLEEQTDAARATLDYLLMQYPDDVSCCWAYSRALSVFQQQNAMDRANTLLKEAVATNRFVPAYLLGDKPFPDDLPDLVGVGDPSEAVEYCDYALNAWTQTPGAVPWLQQHSP